jgi:hypothetical protein
MPSSQWRQLSIAERQKLMQEGIYRFGGRGMCQKDFQIVQRRELAERRKKWGKVPRPLSESEIARLRRLVGVSDVE